MSKQVKMIDVVIKFNDGSTELISGLNGDRVPDYSGLTDDQLDDVIELVHMIQVKEDAR